MSGRYRVLVAEDDEHIRIGLVDTLESEGYEVEAVGDGAAALEAFRGGRYHLALLDVMMPEKDGYEVCQAIRRKDRNVGIIMLTAKGQEIDKVLGLKLGADDYVTKPFGIHELLARLESTLRRAGASAVDAGRHGELPGELDFSGFAANRKTLEAVRGENKIGLTAKEIVLLEIFWRRPNEALSRDELLNAAWGIDYMGTTRTLDQHVLQLRKKLEKIGVERFLETVHGVGYRWRKE
ncbi:MAG: response regulator transcription factor [Verrucomicrobiota bacterium]